MWLIRLIKYIITLTKSEKIIFVNDMEIGKYYDLKVFSCDGKAYDIIIGLESTVDWSYNTYVVYYNEERFEVKVDNMFPEDLKSELEMIFNKIRLEELQEL
jgi:hypothetical protein